MKKILFKILLLLVGAGLCTVMPLSAASPQSAAAWRVSSALYADKNSKMPQVDYTREYRDLQLPEFWIDKLDDPDRLILNGKQIERFNVQIARIKKLTYPSGDFNTSYSGNWVGDKLAREFAFLAARSFYRENGDPIDENLMTRLWKNCDFDTIPEHITARYAIVVHYANHRLSPSNLTLLKKPQQKYFDRNQNAALDIGTPLAILHPSADKKWYFSLSPGSYGWIAAEDIAFTTKKGLLAFSRSRNFIVTTQPKNALFTKGHYRDFVRMGVRLPFLGKLGKMMRIEIPERRKNGELKLTAATIKASDAHLGYLPYTPRTIISQAFKFLNAPYGWGGMFGEQDCSKFIQQLYAVTGILLPRNSGDQTKACRTLLSFDGGTKERAKALLGRGEPGSTLLHLPGHIMLYLGEERGTPYIIHTVWGAVEGHNPLARTAVTSLYFKNYIDKLDSAVTVRP